jgi:ABC-type multidrug transport system fused ATPase/permease subunit
MPAADRFFELMDAPGEPADRPGAVDLDGVRETIRFRDVHFGYGREAVLQGIDFEARAGETVAIVGRTGAGKTTLVDLLVRFYEPQAGAIEIDGTDIRDVRRTSLLDQVAIVTQEPFLFEGSIRENIHYGAPEATDAEIEDAAVAAHVKEFALGLPDGFETEVGEAGALLSGGQRQRVTLARAILRNPSILILDEATSSLDSKSERLVQDALEALMRGRTAFVIAHRLSTIRNADRILVLEEGRIAATGDHAGLIERSPLYRELVALQTSGAA